MSDFSSFLRKWTGRATPRKSEFKNETQIVQGHPQRADDKADDHQRGAEGHVFQVNGDPQQIDDKTDDHQRGAEGHVFQVNGDPQQLNEKADDAP